TPASAQGVGFGGGIAFDPTQGVVGAQFESAPLADRIHFRGGVDGAFGNDLQLALVDIFFLYKYPVGPLAEWEIYQGVGPTIVLARCRDDVTAPGRFGAPFGAAHRNGFFFEFKVSGGGGPSLRLTAGYTLRPNKKP